MGSSISLGEMYVTYKVRTDELSRGMSQFKSELRSADEAAQSTGSNIFSSFGKAAGGVLDFGAKLGQTVFGIQTLANTAVSLGQSLLAPAAAAEQVQGSLEVFTGSAAKAKQEMDDLNVAASHSPFKTMDVDQFALKLQSVGVSAKDVIPDFVALGDGLDAVGRTSSADLSQLTDAFIKIQTQGHLTTETMNSFAAMGIDAWSVLEKQTGKSHEALQSMISSGLYPAKDAMRDLTTGMEANPLYHGQMANDANVFNGAISTLQSNWDQVVASFGSPVIKALEPELAHVSDTLSSPGFKDFAGSVGQSLVVTFRTIGSVAQGAEPELKMIGQLFVGMGNNWAEFAANLDTSQMSAAFNSLKTSVGGISSTFQLVLPLINNLDNFLIGLATDAAPLVGPSFQIMGQVITGANGAIQGIILSVEGNLLPALQNLGHEVFPIIAAFLDWLQKSNLIPIAFAGLKIGIDLVIGGVSFLINIGAGLIHFFAQTELGSTLLKAALILLGTAFGILALVGIVAFISAIPGMVAGFIAGAAGAWSMAAGVIALTWPILAVIAVIALIILAINHWGDICRVFQQVWTVIWAAVSSFFVGIFTGVWQFLQKWGVDILLILIGPVGLIIEAWRIFPGFFTGIGQAIWFGIKWGINQVIGGINDFIGFIDSMQIHIPAIGVGPIQTPAFDWNGVGLQKIPLLASGGAVAPGEWYVAGDPGPNSELIYGGTSGASVYSHSQSSNLITLAVLAALAQQQQQPIVVQVENHSHHYLDGREITDSVQTRSTKEVRRGGPIR